MLKQVTAIVLFLVALLLGLFTFSCLGFVIYEIETGLSLPFKLITFWGAVPFAMIAALLGVACYRRKAKLSQLLTFKNAVITLIVMILLLLFDLSLLTTSAYLQQHKSEAMLMLLRSSPLYSFIIGALILSVLWAVVRCCRRFKFV